MASGLIGRAVGAKPARLSAAAHLIQTRWMASETEAQKVEPRASSGGGGSNMKTFQIYRWISDSRDEYTKERLELCSCLSKGFEPWQADHSHQAASAFLRVLTHQL